MASEKKSNPMAALRANDLIRQELGVFSVKDLNEFFEKTEHLEPAKRKKWCRQIETSKELIYKLIKFSMWQHYEALGEFHDDLRKADWVRGGINSLIVLKEYVDEKAVEHEASLRDSQKPDDPNNPLPENETNASQI